VVGVAMIKTDFTLWQALGMSLLVFAGSAQLAALPLIIADAPIWIIFLTGLVVNLRFVIFSVILAPHFPHLGWRQRAFWSYLTADVSIIFFMQRFPTNTPEVGKFEYLKGLLIPNWTAWQIGSITGILLGSQIPDEWGIGYAGTLAILCVLLPMVLNRATLVGVLVAASIALFTTHWPYQLGMLLAVVVGMVCSMIWEEWQGNQLKEKRQS
jgi:predicted branched-subunit amino acid permease